MKKIFFCLLALGAGLAATSCEDFLEADNKANVNAEDFLQTPEGLVSLRAKVYSDLKPLATNVEMYEWGTDLYIATRTSSPNDFHLYNITAETNSLQVFYKNCYTLINDANCLLKYGAGNPRYVAEAIWMRSYGHFILAEQFGPVPYVDKYIESANRDYPRMPLKELYGHLIADLEGIANNTSLPAHGTDEVGCVSRQAVQALLAKVCLTAGWDLDTELVDAKQGTYNVKAKTYFEQAVSHATEAIDGKPLTIPFDDKWSYKHENNEEEIFSVQYQRAAYPGDVLNGGHQLQNTYGSQYGDPAVSGLKACSGVLAQSAKSLYLWAKGDERYDATFMPVIYNYFGNWPQTGYYAFYHLTSTEQKDLGIANKFFPWYATTAEVEDYIAAHKSQFVQGTGANLCHVNVQSDPATVYYFKADGSIERKETMPYRSYLLNVSQGTSCVRKFDDPETQQQANISNDYRDIVLFHLSDMYLVAAEASLLADQSGDALKYINDVRRRAKATELTSFDAYEADYEHENFEVRPLDVILDERARELYAERTRWTDLRRTRQMVRYNVAFNDAISSVEQLSDVRGNIRWYRPIPAKEIANNISISNEDQNPGY